MDSSSNNQLLEELPTKNEVILNSNNNEQTSSDYIPPPIYDNNNNNIPQEVSNPPEYPSIQEITPQQNSSIPQEELNIQDPLSQNVNTSIPETNTNTYNVNTNPTPVNNDNQLYVEPMKVEEPEKPKLTVQQQTRMKTYAELEKEAKGSCCEECCDNCCECDNCCKCDEQCCDDCCDNCNKCLEATAQILACLAAIGKLCEACGNIANSLK